MALVDQFGLLMDQPGTAARLEAIDRAKAESPFLRELMALRPELVAEFIEEGCEAAYTAARAVRADFVETSLRVQRAGVALTVALGDLAGELQLERVTAMLSDFADSAIDQALATAIRERVPDARPEGMAAIAMGKLGSHELNYSSDVDLILLYDPDRLPRRDRDDPAEAAVRIGRRTIELLQKRTGDGYVVRVDLRLRPSPEVTPIALPVNAAISHYESSALPWERAAFIRARACAGDLALGQQFLSAIEPFVWRRSMDFGVVDEVRQISARIRDHYAQGASLGPGYDLKRGRGGIREVEFFTQIHQLIHGGRDPLVRAPATLEALQRLEEAGRLEQDDARALASTYRLLRTVEHRVQMIEDAQTHLLPPASDALDAVARLQGLRDGTELIAQLRPGVEHAGKLFDGLAPTGGTRLSRDPDVLRADLLHMGFAEPDTAVRYLSDWRSGRPRSLRSPAAQEAFELMLPALLQAVARGPNPEHALNRLGDIIERVSSGVNLFRLLEARPDLSEVLAKILAYAPALAEQLARRPELLEGLFDASSFAPPPEAPEIAAQLREAMAGQPFDIAIDRARRMVNERRFALGVQLIDGRDDPLAIAAGYSRVAEGALLALAHTAVQEFETVHGRIEDGELVILGLGRLGGGALTHASDLDLIFLHSGQSGVTSSGTRPLGLSDYFNRLASRVSAALSVPTAAGPLYDVDTRLRPQGAQGMLAVSLAAFDQYQREEAWTWEHMALCRARPVFGSDEARAEAEDLISSILRQPRDPSKVRRDAAKMRDEMGRHKPAASAFDVKLGRGGLVDLEFAVHVLQLTTGEALTPDLDSAVKALSEAKLIPTDIVEAHRLLTRMLVMMRLVAPADVKPTIEMWELVASACGHPSWDALVAEHDRARQSVAQLWDRIRQEAV